MGEKRVHPMQCIFIEKKIEKDGIVDLFSLHASVFLPNAWHCLKYRVSTDIIFKNIVI